MKRKKVGCIYEYPKDKTEALGAAAVVDGMIFDRIDGEIRRYVEDSGGELCGHINHLREEFPSYTANSAPNRGTMVAWRGWAIAKYPEVR